MYVDAIYDYRKNIVNVVERINGERIFVEYKPAHTLYYAHPSGQYKDIFGDSVRRFVTTDLNKFRAEKESLLNKGKYICESDVRIEFRTLSDHYKGADTPVLNVGFFDIETDWDDERGYSEAVDAFNPITAITIYKSHTKELITLALRPHTVTQEEAFELEREFENTEIYDYDDEANMLLRFLEIIQDIDVFTGWNSEIYDIPYVVNRIKRLLGEDAARLFCLWDKEPIEKEVLSFGRPRQTYDFPGRPHLDYQNLYKKHNTQQLHSYRLDFVSEMEVGANKTKYEGTLDDLYKKDFRLFIEYNRTDVILLVKIDAKRKFLDLSNQVAHDNCVFLKTTMGSVALVEQAIINSIHEFGMVAPDRKIKIDDLEDIKDEEDELSWYYDDDSDDDEDEKKPVVGAYVAVPKVGIHNDIGCIDINSLYPSCIRALNMSPETLIGQLVPEYTDNYINSRIASLPKNKRAEAWEGIFACLEYTMIMEEDTEHPIKVAYEDGREVIKTGKEWYNFIFNPVNKVCVSANGTLFRTDQDGIIPMLLARWYSERKMLQGKEKEYTKKLEDPNLTPEQIEEYTYWESFWNQRQQAKKILLNSLYGALLNEALRFHDARLGKSVTLTGRSIVKHMNSEINRIIAGEYDYKGEAIFYSDTDSSYFSAYPFKDKFSDETMPWNRDNVIILYDAISDMVNESFPPFMDKAFNTGLERGAVIQGGRELVASKTLFIRKKKYAALMYDKEGKRLDADGKHGKLKVMGLDLKRADTPKYMQVFLEEILTGVLTDVPTEELYEKIKQFRREFTDKVGWEKGSPKAIKKFSEFVVRFERGIKGTIPSHVKAGIQWNRLCDIHEDRFVMRCGDGTKVIVCQLKKNSMGIDRIAYPIDEPHLPEWFKELPFNHDAMEQTIVDKKLDNLIGVLEWDMPRTKDLAADEFFVF